MIAWSSILFLISKGEVAFLVAWREMDAHVTKDRGLPLSSQIGKNYNASWGFAWCILWAYPQGRSPYQGIVEHSFVTAFPPSSPAPLKYPATTSILERAWCGKHHESPKSQSINMIIGSTQGVSQLSLRVTLINSAPKKNSALFLHAPAHKVHQIIQLRLCKTWSSQA